MVIKNVNLETVCGITSKLPDNPYNEVAFAGKSNVADESEISGAHLGAARKDADD